MRSIPYGRQEITEEDITAVNKVLRSDYLTQGPEIQKFESAFAEFVGSNYAVAVANGTAALHLSALALGVSPGQSVITTPLTFAASANCIRYCGGDVELCDVDPRNQCLDPNQVEEILKRDIKGKIKGIIPVDYAGHPVDLEVFSELANRYGLWMVEDACHAPGAYFTDTHGAKQRSGNCEYSDLAIFSFHPVKHIAAGEGGMITTNSPELSERLQTLRTHGIRKDHGLVNDSPGGWYYELQELGFNYRLTDFQAALGLSQLMRADKGLGRRQQIAEIYAKELESLPLELPSTLKNSLHAFHLYVIQTTRRKDLYDYLHNRGIFTQVHYVPLNHMPYYQKAGWKKGDFPVAETFYDRCLSIPMYPSLTEEDQDYVIQSIGKFFT